MIGARALTFRRLFPRALRLLLTVVAVALLGFYGVARAAQRVGSSWPYRALPIFLNLKPQDVRDRALAAMRDAALPEGARAERARAELLRLGGAALPHVLTRLDSLEPGARGRVAMALGPVALRMRVASPEDVASPERALLFFGRFWQDRSIEFRPTTVRRAVERLAERSLSLRRDDVIHADTYALEALITALGKPHSVADVARVQRLHPVLMHITGRGEALPRAMSLEQAVRAVEDWQRLWLEEGADYTVLEGPRRVAALVTETQYGKWLAQAYLWKLGRAHDGSRVSERVLGALPASAIHVLCLLLAAVATAAGSALLAGPSGWPERARARVALASASLVASYPLVLTLALAFEIATKRPGVLELCAVALRTGDVNLLMGALVAFTLLAELLVALPAQLTTLGAARTWSEDE
jgi:peptide/nickel transport system permease protein